MAEGVRSKKPGEKQKAAAPQPAAPQKAGAESAGSKKEAPAWAGQPANAAMPVQTKLEVNEPGDAYEREAEAVGDRVASGGSHPAQQISSLAPGSHAGAQHAAKPEAKKDDKTKAVQKAAKPADKKDDKTKAVQKADKPSGKEHEKKAVQKAAKPESKKEDKTKAVQKAAKPEGKKDDKTKAVQKAARPEGKKDDKTKALQKAEKGADKKAAEQKPERAKAVQKSAGKEPHHKESGGEHKDGGHADGEHAAVQTALKKDTLPPEKTMPGPQAEAAGQHVVSGPGPASQGGHAAKGQDAPTPTPTAAAGPGPVSSPVSGPVQKSEAAGGSASAGPPLAAMEAISSKGAGSPLAPDTRSSLERGMGADLSGVRVHDDARAHESAAALNARAFTHQNDIWLGRGESQADKRLMAHEATHVIQQSDSVQRSRIQRAGGGVAGAAGAAKADDGSTEKEKGVWVTPDGASVDTNKSPRLITIPELQLPKEYGKFESVSPKTDFELKPPKARTDQRANWRAKIAGPGIDKKPVDKLLTPNMAVDHQGKNDPKGNLWYLKLTGEDSFMVGDKESLIGRLKLPNWNEKGEHKAYDVDHVRELQLGGEPDDLNNYQLLEATANRSSGSRIKNEIEGKIMGVVEKNVGSDKAWTKAPDLETVKSTSKVVFQKVTNTLSGVAPGSLWKKDDIAAKGGHLDAVTALNSQQIIAKGLDDSPKFLKIFTSSGAGAPKMVPWNDGKPTLPKGKSAWGFKGLEITGIDYQPGGVGTITGQAWKSNKIVDNVPPITLKLAAIPDLQFSATASAGSLRQQLGSALKAKGASPIELLDADLDDSGIGAKGVIRPDFSILKGTEIDFAINGDDFELSKTFYGASLKLPGPVSVTGGALTITAGTAGLEIDANVGIAIEKVGKGSIAAKGAMAQGFELKGTFDFETKMFDPAKVEISYKRPPDGEGEWSGSGELGIKENSIKGIKSANIVASYAKGELSAKGDVKLSVPGVQEGTMEASFSEKDGISIGGKFTLADDIPGISNGSVEAKVEQKGEDWAVTAKGTATPKIPGVAATLDVAYEDGAITIEGHAAYEKGMIKGEITLGATNRPVDDQGHPGGAPTESMRAYGGGSVTMRIAPWLQGTAGIRLLPNGEIEVSGTIALPSTLDVFNEKSIHKNIFSIHVDIPIVGVAVAGQRIGIFATIGGGLDADAGIGPGQLRDTALKVTYNPAHEEDTHVVGDARLYVPAHAGLRLSVHGGIGAGIPIVSATAGLEVGGSLGLEGAIDTKMHVDWSPRSGLELSALGEIYVQPKFKFDLTGYVDVSADLLVTTVSLYEKRFTLAQFEYGSDLRFGVKFPIHYKEGQPFDISLSDVEFIAPQIDAGAVLEDLVHRVV